MRPIGEFDQAPFELSLHVYPNPYKSELMTYRVGGRYAFLRLGQSPIQRLDSDGALDGNFGVIYNIRGKVSNPTSVATDVELVFEASGGYTGGLFVVNGSYVKTPLLQPKAEYRIIRIRLVPGAERYLNITTLPLSGGSYPATLTLRPVQSR